MAPQDWHRHRLSRGCGCVLRFGGTGCLERRPRRRRLVHKACQGWCPRLAPARCCHCSSDWPNWYVSLKFSSNYILNNLQPVYTFDGSCPSPTSRSVFSSSFLSSLHSPAHGSLIPLSRLVTRRSPQPTVCSCLLELEPLPHLEWLHSRILQASTARSGSLVQLFLLPVPQHEHPLLHPQLAAFLRQR